MRQQIVDLLAQLSQSLKCFTKDSDEIVATVEHLTSVELLAEFTPLQRANYLRNYRE